MTASERNERTAEALAIMIAAHFPKLTGRVRVKLQPRSPYLFHAKRTEHGVTVRTSIKLDKPADMGVIPEMARACLECVEDRTSAVRIQQMKGTKRPRRRIGA